jgi:hypothetical protein
LSEVGVVGDPKKEVTQQQAIETIVPAGWGGGESGLPDLTNPLKVIAVVEVKLVKPRNIISLRHRQPKVARAVPPLERA